jgi:(1->4)-alpha-D-glucan 1-alpha-D-glucosylmutase
MQGTFPGTMTALSTHDTKRADDVRARLTVLSEMPHQFAEAIAEWARYNEQYKTASATQALPDRNSEYFLYQTLIGAWPIDSERTKAYMQKAMREAKQQTSWVANNKEYEDALNSFIDAILGDTDFVNALEDFVARLILPGRVNSLSQTLLKNISPGVPDQYQGSELWDLSLVDPDNRRPVDYELRRKLLSELPQLSAEEIMGRMDEGLPKLHVIHQSLLLRREHPEWFGADAAYTPVYAVGAKAQHAVAFLRGTDVLALAPRHIHTLAGDWAGTTLELPAGTWHNRLTGERIEIAGDRARSIAHLLREFPVALFNREENPHA